MPKKVEAEFMTPNTDPSTIARPLRIAIAGDFDGGKASHWATEAALFHAAARLQQVIELDWVATETITARGAEACLDGFDGLWGAPGSPFASFDGMLAAIAFARGRHIPYLGTCAGFQYALIEFSRNVLGLVEADSAENEPRSSHVVITPVSCFPPGQSEADTQQRRLSGADAVYAVPGTLLAGLCGTAPVREEYFCRFEVNHAFLPRWQAAGLTVAARDERGAMRALTLPAHRFFLATLFQPQRSSRVNAPHPIIVGYLRACLSARR